MCGFEVLMLFTSRDDIYLFWDLVYCILTFYSYFIEELHGAHMFQCRGQILLVKPPERQMLWY